MSRASESRERATGRLTWVVLALLLVAPAARGDAPQEDDFAALAPGVQIRAHDSLYPSPGWPRWLKDYGTHARTDETSAIVYAGRDSRGRRCFFLADDTGFLHFCRVAQASDGERVTLQLERVQLAPSLIALLGEREKWDFEALALPADPARGRGPGPLPDTLTAFLSIEGHGAFFAEETDLFAIRFVRLAAEAQAARLGAARDPEAPSWRAEGIGEAILGARFFESQVRRNRGLEGIAIGERMVFLGLEGYGDREDLKVWGTMLYLYDRARNVVGQVATRRLGIQTISALEALSDTVTVALDRNRQALTVLRWDAQIPGQLNAVDRFPLDLPAPDGLRYAIPSVEGLTVDERGDIWCTTDPWAKHYQPVGAAPESLLVYLAAKMPMLYRFPGDIVWGEVGLAHLFAPEEGGASDAEDD